MRRLMPSLPLAALGSIAVFPVIVVALHLVQYGDFHPVRQAVSELALGKGGWLMAVAFCALGLGTLLLALVLRRSSARPRTAPVLLAIAGLLSFVSAFVHADPSSAANTSNRGRIHELAGVGTFMLTIAAMFFLVRAFRRDATWHRMARPTQIWAWAALASFLLIPTSGQAYFGLAQRVFIAVMLGWLLAASLYAYRVERVAAAAGTSGAGFEPAPSRV